MSTRSSRDTQACACNDPSSPRLTPIVNCTGIACDPRIASATTARSRHVLNRPSRRPVASIAHTTRASFPQAFFPTHEPARAAPARTRRKAKIRTAAAVTICMTVTTLNNQQSESVTTLHQLVHVDCLCASRHSSSRLHADPDRFERTALVLSVARVSP